MKTKLFSTSLLILNLVSCASMNEKIKGHSAAEIQAMSKTLKGKNRKEIIKILGKPIAEGFCNDGAARKKVTLIYRKEDSVRYKHALDMTTEKYDLKCTMLDLTKKVNGEYVYSGLGSTMDLVSCNQKSGYIERFVKNPKHCSPINN